jgi:hypothetical protein
VNHRAPLLARLATPLAATLATLSALPASATAVDATPLFSSARAGAELPPGWARVPFSPRKSSTDYDLVTLDGAVVLHAHARAAVSFALHELPADQPLDLSRHPNVHWRWKLGTLPRGADNAIASKEDAAARLVFMFDGDRAHLPFRDRAVMRMAEALSGHPLPYATLMYVTSNVAPVGTIIANPHTRRVQMVVAAQADDALGRWQVLSRDVARDFRSVFGEDPGPLRAYGVMTDSDNTGGEAEAWYGDIVFSTTP